MYQRHGIWFVTELPLLVSFPEEKKEKKERKKKKSLQ